MEIEYLNYKGEREVIRGVSHLQNIDNERFVFLFNDGKKRKLRIGRIESIWHGEDEEAEAEREREAAALYAAYCEQYEPTYNPKDGSM